jgi:hypothetical protein
MPKQNPLTLYQLVRTGRTETSEVGASARVLRLSPYDFVEPDAIEETYWHLADGI